MNSFAIIILIFVSILHADSKPATLTGGRTSNNLNDGKLFLYKNNTGGGHSVKKNKFTSFVSEHLKPISTPGFNRTTFAIIKLVTGRFGLWNYGHLTDIAPFYSPKFDLFDT